MKKYVLILLCMVLVGCYESRGYRNKMKSGETILYLNTLQQKIEYALFVNNDPAVLIDEIKQKHITYLKIHSDGSFIFETSFGFMGVFIPIVSDDGVIWKCDGWPRKYFDGKESLAGDCGAKFRRSEEKAVDVKERSIYPTLPIVQPRRDCDGNCKPCPLGVAPWQEVNHESTEDHASESGFHWHKLIYIQDKDSPDCTCYPYKQNSFDGIRWE